VTHVSAALVLFWSLVRYAQGKPIDAVYAACVAAVILLGQIAINTHKK
jgi:hypothetical protein